MFWIKELFESHVSLVCAPNTNLGKSSSVTEKSPQKNVI